MFNRTALSIALLLSSSSFLYAQDAYQKCLEASPYVNKQVAEDECRGTASQLQSVPERLAEQDQALEAQNEQARENMVDFAAAELADKNKKEVAGE